MALKQQVVSLAFFSTSMGTEMLFLGAGAVPSTPPFTRLAFSSAPAMAAADLCCSRTFSFSRRKVFGKSMKGRESSSSITPHKKKPPHHMPTNLLSPVSRKLCFRKVWKRARGVLFRYRLELARWKENPCGKTEGRRQVENRTLDQKQPCCTLFLLADVQTLAYLGHNIF